MNLQGTLWRHKSAAAVVIQIIADTDASRMSYRSLLAQNVTTGRRFRITPEGIQRKYSSTSRFDLEKSDESV